jgi:hypothetical protein
MTECLETYYSLRSKLTVADLGKMLPKICLGSLNLRQLIWIRGSIVSMARYQYCEELIPEIIKDWINT